MIAISTWVVRAATEYGAGRPLCLLFAYDGTLAPVVPRPSLTVLPAGTRATLAELAARTGVTVGIISGRPLGRLKELVGLTGLAYAGSGGMHLDLGGEVLDDAAAEFDRVADPSLVAASGPVRWFPGAWVERKPGCLAVHYRALAPVKAAGLVEEVRNALADLGPECPPLAVREGSRALEVSLARAWTKADAVDRVLHGRGREPFAVFAGDAATDAEAVARVNARGGLTIGVGPEAPAGVRFRVPTPGDLGAGLARLAAEVAPARRYAPPLPGASAAGRGRPTDLSPRSAG